MSKPNTSSPQNSLKSKENNLTTTTTRKSYAQTSKINIEDIVHIKDSFPTLSFKKIIEVSNVLNKSSIVKLSQTLFSLYFHNQWTNFHKISCSGKFQMRAIHTYVGCTKATTND